MLKARMVLMRAAVEVIYGEGEPPPPQNPPPGNPPPQNPPPAPPPPQNPPPGNPPPQGKWMTQEDINRMMADNKAQLVRKNQELQKQLESQLESGRLTAEEAESARNRIQELESEFKTTTEVKDAEIKKLNDKYETDKKRLETEAQTWQARFTDMLIANDLLAAAGEFKAYNPQQVVALLRPMARKVEKIGPDGKPTGEFETKIKFTGEKEGKPVQLDLSPKDTVKMMTEMTQQYGNLFISAATGGLGGGNDPGIGNGERLPDLSSMSDADYEKYRKTILAKADENTRSK